MQENKEPKICKQCKYWSYEHSTSVCRHDMSKVLDKEVNKITGSVTKPIYRECVHMRFYSNCGEEGVLFEPRVSIIKQIIKQVKQWYANKTTR